MKIQTNKVFKLVNQAKNDGFTTVSAQGSSRSGKTRNIMIWLILYCLQHDNTSVSIVRSTMPSLKRSVFRDFKDIMLQLEIYDTKLMNKSDFVYTFPNGSFVEFFGADNEAKLRGSKRQILFVNEANELSFIEWQQLQMRTTQFSIVDYNPSFSEEHWLCGLNLEQSTKHFITTYKDNPFLEKKVIEEIESLKHKNENLWRIYGLGLQSIIEGLIFTNVKVIPRIPDLCKKRCVGMDFGFTNDPTVIVEVGLVESEKALYIDEIVYRTQMLTTDIIKMLKSETPRHKIISESADPRLIQEIYRAGLNIHPVKKFQGSIDAGITKMQEYNIYITERSLNVIREFKNYVYAKDKEGKLTNTPVDAFNHAIDAVRYVILNEVLGGEKKAINLQRVAKLVY
jgi:phage terminase large subunit